MCGQSLINPCHLPFVEMSFPLTYAVTPASRQALSHLASAHHNSPSTAHDPPPSFPPPPRPRHPPTSSHPPPHLPGSSLRPQRAALAARTRPRPRTETSTRTRPPTRTRPLPRANQQVETDTSTSTYANRMAGSSATDVRRQGQG